MAGTVKLLSSPAYLPTSAANIYTSCGGSSLIKDIVTQLHFANDATSGLTVSVWLGSTGASAAGTEILKNYTIAGNSTYDLYTPGMVLTSTLFLTGSCNVASGVAVTVMGQEVVL
jgi:hypothetical protein